MTARQTWCAAVQRTVARRVGWWRRRPVGRGAVCGMLKVEHRVGCCCCMGLKVVVHGRRRPRERRCLCGERWDKDGAGEWCARWGGWACGWGMAQYRTAMMRITFQEGKRSEGKRRGGTPLPHKEIRRARRGCFQGRDAKRGYRGVGAP